MNVDQRLITQCIEGDRKAQLRLYDLCYSYMMSICIRYCKDKQEAGARLNLSFLKVLKHLETFDSRSSFKAWISKITLRSIIDEFRAQQKHYQQTQYHGEFASDIVSINDSPYYLNTEFDVDYIMSVINKLPPMDKQVFNLFAIDGYSHKEIATLLNISEGTSKWHVHEARKKVQGVLLSTTKKASLK